MSKFSALAKALKNRVGRDYMTNTRDLRNLSRDTRKMAGDELVRRRAGKEAIYPHMSEKLLREEIKKNKKLQAKYQQLLDQGVTPKIALKEAGKSVLRGVAYTAAAGGAGGAFLFGASVINEGEKKRKNR